MSSSPKKSRSPQTTTYPRKDLISMNYSEETHQNVLPEDYVLQPRDILCGKTKQSFNHVGNKRFRVTVSLYLQRYTTYPSRGDRSALIASVVDQIHSDGGRFVRRENNRYVMLSVHQARSKVGHALRDAAQQKAGTKRTRTEANSGESSHNSSLNEEDESFSQTAGRAQHNVAHHTSAKRTRTESYSEESSSSSSLYEEDDESFFQTIGRVLGDEPQHNTLGDETQHSTLTTLNRAESYGEDSSSSSSLNEDDDSFCQTIKRRKIMASPEQIDDSVIENHPLNEYMIQPKLIWQDSMSWSSSLLDNLLYDMKSQNELLSEDDEEFIGFISEIEW